MSGSQDKTENLHEGHRKRLRRSYIERGGLEGFHEHQILELLLFYAVGRRDVNPLAHKLIERFGSLRLVLGAGVEALMEAGLSENTAALLSLVNDIGQSLDRKEALDTVVRNTDDAFAICRSLLFRCKTETAAVICLDAKNRIIRVFTRSDGFADSVAALPKWIVDAAVTTKAQAVLLAHNHPSGASEPSEKDKESTLMLSRLLSAIGVTLYDHIIVTHSECFSIVRNYKKQIASEPAQEIPAEDETGAEVS